MARSRELSKIFSSDTLVSLDNEIQSKFIAQAIEGQTDNLLELRNSSGNVVSSIGPTGALTGIGKILQVVRATDVTNRSTTSASYVDASISVTITPQKNDSAIMIISAGRCTVDSSGTDGRGAVQITDSSNNAISGAESFLIGSYNVNLDIQLPFVLIAWATPATTSPVTYKLRFAREGSVSSFQINNNISTGQMFAIEVAA
jgi:hypothetical protein